MAACPKCGFVKPSAPRRKLPEAGTPGRHAHCVAHVPHYFPKAGFTCIVKPRDPTEPIEAPEQRVALLDVIAQHAEAYFAAERERRGLPTKAWRRAWAVLTHEMTVESQPEQPNYAHIQKASAA